MDLSTLPIAPIGATGVLALVVLFIVRGMLIPRSMHEDRMRDKDAQILFYQTAYEREAETNKVLTAQVSTLMEVARTADHVLSSLPIGNRQGGGGRDELASS